MFWLKITEQAKHLVNLNNVLKDYLDEKVLKYDDFASALANHLGQELKNQTNGIELNNWFKKILENHPEILQAAENDINRLVLVNPACPSHLTAFLSFRGILAFQAYRIANAVWNQNDIQSAVLLQNWIATKWNIDIHPAAKIGSGLFIDHGIGIVIGETAVVEDEVSIWHGVTLGSTLSEAGDRHPKIRKGALICAGATVLGNIDIGENSIVAANAVVLKPVEAGVVVAGAPAKVVGQAPSSLATFTTKIGSENE
uniref:serine O-acetyltransferase EpsC n=1 Tax=Acinetobacter pittii TaxID=48296 RepID=UPI001BDB9E83|nr:serine O-acetyltransferase EpsC [Acinetobacter pittii]